MQDRTLPGEPNIMNVLSFLNSLRPALPYSAEKAKDADGKCVLMSNGELRRMLQNRAILLNGETDWKWDEEAPPMVWQLVFFPKATKAKEPAKFSRRTTIV